MAHPPGPVRLNLTLTEGETTLWLQTNRTLIGRAYFLFGRIFQSEDWWIIQFLYVATTCFHFVYMLLLGNINWNNTITFSISESNVKLLHPLKQHSVAKAPIDLFRKRNKVFFWPTAHIICEKIRKFENINDFNAWLLELLSEMDSACGHENDLYMCRQCVRNNSLFHWLSVTF